MLPLPLAAQAQPQSIPMKSTDLFMSRPTALITGASSGIGLELAREFARHEHPLIIVAPVAAELGELTKRLHADFGVPVTPIVADLTEPAAPEKIFQMVVGSGAQVDILVNNAGLGQRGKFWEIPIGRDLEMIRLNIEAVVRLTKLFLPPMVARGEGRILNTASVAGFEPGPTLAVYHATKAFVLSWSEAIATELEDTGVTVTALCPGPVDTDFFTKAGMVESAAFQKANVMAPQDVAQAAHAATMRGERVIVPGGMNKAMIFSRRLTGESVQARKNEKLYADVAPEDHKREPGEVRAEAAAKGK
jgi:short-subunit dehydrogenase